MNVWLACFPLRLLFSLAMILVVYVAHLVALEDGGFPPLYYGSIITVFALYRAATFAMFVGLVAFFARISDPMLGGTYMTFFNTMSNLGNRWPISFNLWLVDMITYKQCSPKDDQTNSTLSNGLEHNKCYGSTEVTACGEGGGTCITDFDGFYTLGIACVVLGCLWFIWACRAVMKWQKMDVTEWRVETRGENIKTTGNRDGYSAETEMLK